MCAYIAVLMCGKPDADKQGTLQLSSSPTVIQAVFTDTVFISNKEKKIGILVILPKRR